MKLPALLLFPFLLTSCLSARTGRQAHAPAQTLQVSGYVLDAQIRRPVAGVPVAKNGTQTRTNKDGFFRLAYPAAPNAPSLFGAADVLGVYSLDYAGRAAIPADTAQRATVLLQRTGYCRPSPDSLLPIGAVPVWACASPWQEMPGSRRAFLMQNAPDQPPHRLRALTVRVGKGGFIRGEPLRVRINRYSGPEEAPGEDLLLANFIICPPAEGVFTYDLSSYEVTVAGKGFFLALEIPVGSDSFYVQAPVVGYIPIGPVLRPPAAFADTRTWALVKRLVQKSHLPDVKA